MTFTLNDMRYLFNLAKSIRYVCAAVTVETVDLSILYYLIVIGEIVSDEKPLKLSEAARTLLPQHVSQVAQEIRNDFMAHSGVTVCTFAKRKFTEIISADKNSLYD